MKELAADGVAVKWWVVVVMVVSIVAWWCWEQIRRLLDRGAMRPFWSIGWCVGVCAVGVALALWMTGGGGEEPGQALPMAPWVDCETNACELTMTPEGNSVTIVPGGDSVNGRTIVPLDAESAKIVANQRLKMLAWLAGHWSAVERMGRGEFLAEDYTLAVALARYVEFELFVHMPQLFDEMAGQEQSGEPNE